jgi:hypothetical protein
MFVSECSVDAARKFVQQGEARKQRVATVAETGEYRAVIFFIGTDASRYS